MNFRTAFHRLLVLIAILWLIGWTGYAWGTCHFHSGPDAQDPYMTFCQYLIFSYTGFGNWPTQIHAFTFWNFTSIALTAVSVPAVALILRLGASWAARGRGVS